MFFLVHVLSPIRTPQNTIQNTTPIRTPQNTIQNTTPIRTPQWTGSVDILEIQLFR